MRWALLGTRRSLSSVAPWEVESLHATSIKEQAAQSIIKYGFAVLPRLLMPSELSQLATPLREHTGRVMASLHAKGSSLQVGSVHGFTEVCLRSPHRYDLPFPVGDKAAPRIDEMIQGIAESALEPSEGTVVTAFSGIVRAEPGCEAQQWHADSAHEHETHTRAHLLNVLIALSDVSAADGPPEFVPRSHRLTNHHRPGATWNEHELLYQSDANSPERIGSEEAPVALPLSAGSALIFDDRVLHRGGANHGETNRDLVYFSLCRASYLPKISAYFEATRSLERYDHRVLPHTVRPAFPGLRLDSGEDDTGAGGKPTSSSSTSPVFADGASGSQLHDSAIAAATEQMRLGAANAGGSYPSSRMVDRTVRAARESMGDLLACAPHEVVFGPSMTALAFHLARALRDSGRILPGDNIVLDPLSHGANVFAWQRLASHSGAEVRWLPVAGESAGIDPKECTLDARAEALAGTIDQRTRLVAVGLASNGVGSIHDAAALIEAARILSTGPSTSALTFVDAVHYAPHASIDVRALDCDFLACSPYKFFAPHCGALYGRAALLESLPVDRLGCADDRLPNNDNCHMSRWEVGTGNYEALAGTHAAIEYLASVGHLCGGADAAAPRRTRLEAAWRAICAHEHELKLRFLEGTRGIAGLSVLGVVEPSRLDRRTPTFAVAKRGVPPAHLAEQLCQRKVYCTAGNHYAGFWGQLSGGLANDEQGMCRIGLLHYNSLDEVDRIVEALDAAR
jgi:cysteine desulfurase family protein (TIGR01976 family)